MVALLADLLRRTGALQWPGTDGLTVEEVVHAVYLSQSDVGCVLSPAESADRHPALADDIRRYFSVLPH